jgi:hypothetical protein
MVYVVDKEMNDPKWPPGDQNPNTCEPATKMEDLCLCFVRFSHTQDEAAARRPNSLRYSRDLVWVHFRCPGDCFPALTITLLSTLPSLPPYSPAISRTNNLLLRSIEAFNAKMSLLSDSRVFIRWKEDAELLAPAI